MNIEGLYALGQTTQMTYPFPRYATAILGFFSYYRFVIKIIISRKRPD